MEALAVPMVAVLALMLALAVAVIIRTLVLLGQTLRENDALRAQIAPFDADGNGKIGGSKPRGKG